MKAETEFPIQAGGQKTILFVMPRLPFPPASGRKTSLYHYCRILSENLGYRLVIAAFLEGGDERNLENAPGFIHKLEVLEKPSGLEKIKGLLQSIFLRKLPMQAALYFGKNAKRQVDLLLEEMKPDIAMADMVRCTEYIKSCLCFKIADLDDMLSIRYQRQLESDMGSINPYGQFILNFPEIVRKILLFAPLKRWITKKEIALLERYERETAEAFDATIFVAQKECDAINQRIGRQAAFAVPNGVDVDYFTRRTPLPDNHVLGFLGALDVAHNEQAVTCFIHDIFPIIRESVRDARLVVIGCGGSGRLKALESESVHFTGSVEDVREPLAECRAFVCPMTFGSGIKTKLLEAMSYGIPVATTSIGAENIGAVPGRDWIVADDHRAFAEGVCRLLTDYDFAAVMGKNGELFVKERFPWKAAEGAFKRILGEA